MAIEVGSAVVAVFPSVKGFGKELSKQLSPEMAAVSKDLSKQLGDGLSANAGAGEKLGADLGKSAAKGFKLNFDKVITGSLKAISASIVGIAGIAVFKGFERLKDIDNAQAKLEGLGHSAKSVAEIMDNALAAVKGTAFGLGEAASVAASITASGVEEGKDLERVLKLVADSATIGGSSLTQMGAIWSKVAATGRLQGDELNQLTSQGIPILQMLADHYGITAAAAQDMVTKGKVNFDDFAAAMESKLGGAAAKSGQTFEGALANVGAALGRLGAALLGTSFKDLATTFDDMSKKLDELSPAAKTFGDNLASAAGWARDNNTWLIPLVSSLTAMALAYRATTIAMGIYATVMAIVRAGSFAAMIAQLGLNAALLANPIGLIIIAVAGLAAGLIALWNTNEGFRDAVKGAWEAIKDAFWSVISWFTDTAAPMAVDAWHTIQDTWTGGVDWIKNAWNGITEWFANLWTSITDGARTGWDNFTTAISDAFTTVKTTVTDVFNNIRDVVTTVWTVLWGVVKGMWDTYGWPVFVAIRAAVLLVAWGFEIMADKIVATWNFWVQAAKLVWENVLVPVFDKIKEGAAWVGDKFVWLKDKVVEAWNWMTTEVSRIYYAIMVPVHDAIWVAIRFMQEKWEWLKDRAIDSWNLLVAGAKWAYENVLVPVFDALKAVLQKLVDTFWYWKDKAVEAWNLLAAGAKWVYDTLLVPIWNAFLAVLQKLVDTFHFWRDKVVAAWNFVADKLGAGWNWIRDNVFTKLKQGVEAIPGYFQRARDAIASAWEKVRATVAKPVEFVVNTVIRDGIVEAWNKVAEKLMLPKWDFKGVSFGYATGGWTGPGSKYTPAGVVHADEYVIRKESQQSLARSYPGLLDYLNTHGAMPGYAGGGQVYEYMWAWARKHLPGMQLTSSYRPGSNDFHGAGKAIDLAAPMTPSGQAAMLAAAKTIYATFGANILELIHTPLGAKGQLKRGRPIDYGAATLAQHVNHVHWAMETFNEAMAGAPALTDTGLDLSPVGSVLKSLLGGPFGLASKGIGKIGEQFGDSDWIKMVTAFAQKPFDEVKKFLEGKIDELFPSFSSSGAYDGLGADSWLDTVKQALKVTGQDEKYTETLLRRMQQESGGNPRAINNSDSNAAAGTPSKGLMQVIDPTFRAYAMPGYNTDIYDPLSNIIASIRYAIDRYGNLSAAYSRPGGYALGGLVTPTLYDQGGYLPPGLTLAANLTGRPERILTAEQDAARSGGHTYVINTVDRDRVDDLVREIEYATRVSTLTRRYR